MNFLQKLERVHPSRLGKIKNFLYGRAYYLLSIVFQLLKARTSAPFLTILNAMSDVLCRNLNMVIFNKVKSPNFKLENF